MTASVLVGDCRDVLAEMEPASVDACVTDPPYELSDDGKASACRVALKLVFPQDAKVEAEFAGEDRLPFFVYQVLALRHGGLIPGPPAAVPEIAVALHGDATVGQVHVEDARVGSVRPPSGERGNDDEAETAVHLGDFALKLADAAAMLDALNRSGCGFDSGGIGIGFRIGATGLPRFLAGGGVVDDGDTAVGSRDRALSDLVGALSGAAGLPVPSLNLSRCANETLSADGALVLCAVLLLGGAELVRTGAGTRRLPPVLESRRVRVVDATHRALTLNLLLHPQSIASFGFMGKEWDGQKVAHDVGVWREVYRVLKPGGHLLAFGGTRTSHRLACAIEDAGFEIRDSIAWVTGQGFPKSRNLDGEWEGWGTALKPAHEPIVVARKPLVGTVAANVGRFGTGAINVDGCRLGETVETWPKSHEYPRYDPGSPSKGTQESGPPPPGRWPANVVLDEEAAAALDAQSGERPPGAFPEKQRVGPGGNGRTMGGGWSGELPEARTMGDAGGASRYFFVAQQDSSTYTVEEQEAQQCGDALIGDGNTFAGRRTASSADNLPIDGSGNGQTVLFPKDTRSTTETSTPSTTTSPTSNASPLDGTTSTTRGSEKTIASSTASNNDDASDAANTSHLTDSSGARQEPTRGIAPSASAPISGNGERTTARATTPTCAPIDSEPWTKPRFFYTAKASRSERDAGLDGLPLRPSGMVSNTSGQHVTRRDGGAPGPARNHHPCVKPVSLMRWLVRLVTPPGGLVLDPFAGSGTTGMAAALEDFDFLGIEMDEDYAEIARRRIAHAAGPLFSEVA